VIDTVHQTPREPDRPQRLAGLATLLGAEGMDLPDLDGPLFRPGVAAEDAPAEWSCLQGWVDRLIVRFDLDYRCVPRCWYRHNGIVEALAALRDHERVSYSDTAAPSAAVDWHRSLRDIEARLREWTAALACGAHHEPSPVRPNIDTDDWSDWLAADAATRRAAALAQALEHDPA
jgi:hypothetical protein